MKDEKAAEKKLRRKVVLESLEPRLLLSADSTILAEPLVGLRVDSPLDSAPLLVAPEAPAQTQVEDVYKLSPLSFEPNRGQADSQVDFVARGLDYGLFLAPEGALLQVAGTSGAEAVVEMELVGGDPVTVGSGIDLLSGASNYLFGGDPSTWITGIPSYAKVGYDDVYPGIDLEYYGANGELEYDWLVSPGADTGAITLQFNGIAGLDLNDKGDLILHTTAGDFTQHAPVLYQVIDGEKVSVSGNYLLKGDGQVGFAVGSYDASHLLVIDPVVSYSTYLGGSRNDYASDIAADSAGNTYVIGTTRSANLAGVASPDTATDRVFVTKYTPDGQIDHTFTAVHGPVPKFDASGFAESTGFNVVVGPDNLPLVSYETFETGTLPLAAGGLLPLPGTHFLHVAKLSAAGLPMFDTIVPVLDTPGYFGPFAFVGVNLATDNAGATYVTYAAVRPTPGGGLVNDPFITKVALSGSVEFTRHLFGVASGIAVDSEHNIYVALTTSRDDLPVTAGAFQENKLPIVPPGVENLTTDVWLAKLDPTASGLLAATYLGGTGNDSVRSLTVDPHQPGRVYLVGTTESENFPLKNPFQKHPTPEPPITTESHTDAFITLLDLTKMDLVASTYFGGSRGDFLDDIALDSAGSVYVAGSTNSRNLPVANPLQPTWTEGPSFHDAGRVIVARDLVVAKFDSALTAPGFSTYYGGSGHDGGASLAVDPNGTIHVAGTSAGQVINTDSHIVSTADFPLLNAQQPVFGGGDFGVFSKLSTDAVVLAIAQRGTMQGRGSIITQGRTFNGIVASFLSPTADAVPGNFIATVDWGDGTTTSAGVVRAADISRRFQVLGTHSYVKPGAYPVLVTVENLKTGLNPVTNIDVSLFKGNQAEPTIAVDPSNRFRLFVASVDEQSALATPTGGGGILGSVSSDAGATWSPRIIADGRDGLPKGQGDPKAVFDQFGNLFLTYLGADRNNIVVALSEDGGETFKLAGTFTAPGSAPGTGPLRVDQPSIAVGPGNVPGSGSVWVTFADTQNNNVVVAGALVTGMGIGKVDIFGAPQIMPQSAGGGFGDIKVGPGGEVLVVWEGSGEGTDADGHIIGPYKVFSSLDPDGFGSVPFGEPNLMLTVADPSRTQKIPAQPIRTIDAEVNLAWDYTAGRVYAAYSEVKPAKNPGDPVNPADLDVFVISSEDNGVRWGSPVRVNDDTGAASQFLPSIAVDPLTGSVAVAWYDTRNDPGNVKAQFFSAVSNDFGQTFSGNMRISLGTSDATASELSTFGKNFGYGDYSGLVFLNNVLYAAWADNSDLERQNRSGPQFEVALAIVGVIDMTVPRVAISPMPVQAIQNQLFTGPVATFQHPDATLLPAQFTAKIQWGDGGNSNGIITQPSGPGTDFLITGSHTYLATGAYPVFVEVDDLEHSLHALPVSNVSAQQGSQAEASIAIDPKNSSHVFAAANDVAGLLPRGISVALSSDGGVKWVSGILGDGSDALPRTQGDPKAVFDQFGNLFLTYLTASPEQHVVVLLSTDGGQNFTLLTTFTDLDTADQPSIAVGPGKDGQGGSVWLTWERGNNPFQIIMAAGAPVIGLGQVGAFTQQLVAPLSVDGVFRNFGDIAVGPQGQVLLSYAKGVPGATELDPSQIVTHLDPDGLGPDPFGPPVLVSDTKIGSFAPIPAQRERKIDNEGNLAWDRSDGEHRGRVYLVYTDAPFVSEPAIDLFGDTNIFLRYSDDNGLNWAEPIQVNDDDPNSQFLPSVAVDQSSGNVGVAWYTAVGPENVKTRFTATLSDDGGSTWNRIAYLVSPDVSDATDPSLDAAGLRFQYGDYTGLAFVNGIMQPIWADNSTSLDNLPDPRRFDIASARIAVAQVSRAPLVVQTFGVNDREGREFTLQIASFTDPNGGGIVSNYKATIDWGDGSPPKGAEILEKIDGGFTVSGTHEYEKLGQYPISVTIKGNHAKGEGTATAVIENAPLDLFFGEFADVRVVRETDFTKVVATLVDLNYHSKTTDFDATIDWGDGSFSDGSITFLYDGGPGEANNFSISGTHQYVAEQTFTATVSVREKSTGEHKDQSGSVVSGDPPLEVQPGLFLDIQALQGINTGDLVLVSFTVPENIDVQLQTGIGEYRATINWGDGEVDSNLIPFVTSQDVTVVGRHTFLTAGQYFPSVTVQDDSGGVFFVPLIAMVEPDVTSQVRASGSGLTYDPVTDRFVGDLTITNTATTDITGPLYVVIHNLPNGVSLDSFTAIDGAGSPLYKVDQSRLSAGASLPPIALEFSNPGRVPISYTVQVFDGIRPEPLGGAGLVFEPNHGQASDAVSFIARGQGYAIGLSAGQASLVLGGSATQAGAAALMEIVGANASLVGVAIDPQPGVSNYFSGGTAITEVPHFGRVRYTEVYSGVDVEFYGRDGLLEYDWLVHPGADADSIALRFRGVDGMVMDRAGNLRLQINGSELVQHAPAAYQIVGGSRHEVAAAYEMQADGSVGFTIGAYDHSVALVIDPVLVYSTYLGGSGLEFDVSVAVDAAGNTYVSGRTGSSDFFTVNPFDPELNQPDTSPFGLSFDAFVTKFNAGGVLVFSTYLGGGSSGFDPVIRETQASSIAVDNAGHVWVGGGTRSLLFPTTTSAPNGLLPRNTDVGAFLTELAADGSSILYSSVFDPIRQFLDIAIDDAGKIYGTGFGFALKLDPTTNTVRYITGTGGLAQGIAVDDLGQAYLGGATNSPAFTTKNALFPVLLTPETQFSEDRAYTGFVMKLSTAGDLLFSTFLDGSAGYGVTDIAVDAAGVIHVVGVTSSNVLPVPGGLDTSLGGSQDGFLIRLANDGSSVLYATYVGGSGTDSLIGAGVDNQGRTYVAGTTDSLDLPTVRAHQPTFGGSEFININPGDGFAASIAADGGSFVYLTYLGGSGTDQMSGVAVDTTGNASYVGRTNSSDLLTRNAAQSRLLGLNLDAFIVRLLAGDAGAITLHNAPFTTVEGNQYNGLVAFFSTSGSETADQFSAMIDWGDGLSSAGTVAGDFRSGFQIFGSHLYPDDIGTHDVFVTLRDSLGRTVTATSTGAGTAGAEGRVRYHVAIDTAALAGTQGLLSFQFNPGAIPGSPDAEARITALSFFGGTAGGSTIVGDASQTSISEFTLRPSAALNRLIEDVTLGGSIQFDLELVGPGLSQPHFGNFADMFALQLLGANGAVPLLSADRSASILRVNLASDGSTQARSSGAAVTVAASGRATVANAPVNLAIAPFTIQEGLEFNGPVATFTNGNPLESAGEFIATINWGDGSPVTSGFISGSNGKFTVSGSHVYQKVGSYPLVVTVIEPDGLEVSSTTGPGILAAQTFKNNWRQSNVPPVSGDFNGDGILDVAVGPFLPVPTTDAGVGILLGHGDGSFALAGFQVTGQNVAQLAVADFNNDGKLDVAAAITTFGETVVELLLGNGDGTLQPTIRLTELRNPGNITAADFNRDGIMDLAYTESFAPTQNTGSNTLKIALGNGDGTFVTPASTTIPFGISHRIYVADMDGDNAPDIILGSRFSSLLAFLRGVGDGTFAAPSTFGGRFYESVAIQDFDDDGKQDVAVVDGFNLNIFSGRGNGTFDAPRQISAPVASSVAAGDFNRDGRPDLAIAETASNNLGLGRVWVFINESAASFAAGVKYEGISFPSNILTGDFNRDGHLDIAVSGTTTVISVIPGFGDGTFASAVRYATGLSEPQNLLRPVSVVASDVNGDTHTDAVLVMSDGRIVTELGHGDGAFQSIVSGNLGFSAVRSNPILTDVNNDGRLDVVAPSRGSGIGIVLGSGDGTFPTSQVSSQVGGGAVVLADFNQDGRLDMAGLSSNTFANGFVAVRLANADGTFQNTVNYPTGATFGGDRTIAVGDFNSDSRADLAVANEGGTLSVLLGNGDGTFAAALNTIVGTRDPFVGITPRAARPGDFNSDGRLDLVVLGFDGTGLVLPGNGNGTFGAAIMFTTTTGLDGGLSGGHEVAVGDFNADGKLDIVASSQSHANSFIPGGGLSVLLGNGDFTFQGAVTYSDRSRPTAMALGDFNGDDRLDIASANINNGNVTSGLVSILLGNADGTFQTAINYATIGANPRSIAAGDLNGDGKLDLAVVNSTNDTAILMGNGDGTFQRPLNYFTTGNSQNSASNAVAIGDLNGDGRADLVAGDSLLFGNGDGTFPNRGLFIYLPAVFNTSFRTSEPGDIAAGDLNGDGNVDLAVSMNYSTTAILFGNGKGSFLPPLLLTPAVATGLEIISNRVSLADMDGDGDLDVITLQKDLVKSGGAVAVWRNNGSGVFSTPLVRNVPMPTYPIFGEGVDMEIGDLNGDSFVDVVVTDSGDDNAFGTVSGGASVMLGIGDGSLAQPVHYLLPPRQRAYRVTLADLNRDGRPEIAALTSPFGFGVSRSAVAVFTNNGNGSFGPAQIYDHGESDATFLAAGDFNSDGAADIIVPDSTNFASTFSIIFAGEGPILVTDAPVSVAATNINPLVGLAFTASVATFTDANPFAKASDFAATVNWGDGQTSTGSIRFNPLGSFEVTGTHTYASGGTFTTTVTVRETGEGTHRGSATARVSATDQAMAAAGLVFDAMANLPFAGVVATFTDADPNGSISDFSSLIHWGDGQTSAGAIAFLVGGGFTVLGTHLYANPGALPVRVDISDIGGSSAIANSTARVAVHINIAPVAVNDAYTTNEDTTLTVLAAQGVLANDTDADADTLSALFVTGPTHGSLTLHPNGAFSYTPAANFNGADSFTYKANDGSANSNVATVNVTVKSVNDAPVANNDSTSTSEDTPIVIHVLANDTDLDGTLDPTTVTITAQPMHGSLQVSPATGAATYTPASNFFGFDSFRYRVKDNGGLLSNIATVSIIVSPVNDAPVATNDSYLVNEDVRRTVTAAKGLLANDTDIDGDTLTAMLVVGPAHGILALDSNGSFAYEPNANYFGSDSFVYVASDGLTQSTPALVSLTILPVNDAPLVASLSDSVFSEGSLLARSDSFSDADPIDAWTAMVDYGDGFGFQALALVGTTFELNHAYADSGAYFTTVNIVDRDGAIGSSMFKVTVQNVAAAVEAGADQSANEGDLVNVRAIFQDPGTLDARTAVIVWGDGTQPQAVSVTENAGTGTLSASHIFANNGVYTVTVTVTDDEGASGSGTLRITVGNLSPLLEVGNDRSVSEGILGSLTATFSDPGTADTHTALLDWGDGTQPQAVSVTENAGTGTLSASHIFANNGVYTVSVRVIDDDGASAVKTFMVTVVNSAPFVDGGPDRAVNEGDVVSLPALILFDLSDPRFGLLTINRVSGSFIDIGALDTHTATVNWGDGTEEAAPVFERQFGPQSSPDGISGVMFSSHRYGDNGLYTVRLSSLDNDGGLGFGVFEITVNNVAPVLTDLSATPIDENGVTTLTGKIVDPGKLDTFTLDVDWGDPLATHNAEQYAFPAGTIDFAVTHQYLDDNPSGTPVDTYTIGLVVTDDDTGTSSNSTSVTVRNVVPTLTNLSATTIDENGSTTLTGKIAHPGTFDTFTLGVNWGDPLSPKNVEMYAFGAGTNDFSLTHQYLDDNPSGTPSDNYTIDLKVTDDDTGGSTSNSTPVTAQNMAPTLTNLSATTIDENGVTTLTGKIVDPGTLDTFTLDVNWGDPLSPKNVEQYTFISGTTAFSLTHQYLDDNPTGTSVDTYTIELAVEDDDRGTGRASTQVIVPNVAPTLTDLFATAINENGVTHLTGKIVHPPNLEMFVLDIDWGDPLSPNNTEQYTFPAGTTSFELTHRYLDDNPTGTLSDVYAIGMAFADDDSGSVATTRVTVTDVSPLLADISAASIDENGVGTLTGTIIDPGTLDTFTLEVNWGDPLSPDNMERYTFGASASRSQSFAFTHHYLDDNPSGTPVDTYRIGLVVTDDDTGTSNAITPVMVQNVAPVIADLVSSAQEVGDAAEHELVTIKGVFSDVGSLDSHTAIIDWGDGTTSEAVISEKDGSGSVSGGHTYKSGGIYDIKVSLSDDDKGHATQSTTALVTGVGLHNGVLQIVGTRCNDEVEVEAKGKCQEWIEVEANFLPDRGHERLFRADKVSSIVILLGDGEDKAKVDKRIDKPVFIDGGAGNDHLMAGRGPAILLGGDGDDVLVGGKGPNLLIGGFGADRLMGGGGDDILLGGTTAYDSDPEALWAILTEWKRTDLSYSQRVSDLMNGGGLNGSFQLNEETVFGGAAKDILTGGSGKDWFFANSCGMGADKVTDRKMSEVVTHPAVQLADKPVRHFDDRGGKPWIAWSDHFGDGPSNIHPCPSWASDFVCDLASGHDRNPNRDIQVVLLHEDDGKSKSTFGVS
jgi:VCBS repeat-containing protein